MLVSEQAHAPLATADHQLRDRVRAHGQWAAQLCRVKDIPDD